MTHGLISPDWFFGYDMILEFLFAIVTLVVAILAFRIYRLTLSPQAKFLGITFSLISISNIIRSVLNLLILTEANRNICEIIKVQSISAFNAFGTYIHIFFMIIGLSVLTFMTLKSNNQKGMILISLISLIAVFSSKNPIYTYYLVSSILLIFISVFYIRNFLRNKKTNTLLIAIAFIFLLFGSIHFLFSVNHEVFYSIAHFLELVAYLLILTNFFRVLKR